MSLTLLAISVLPVVLMLVFVYRKDKYEKEPIKLLLKTFFVGCLSVIPAALLEGFLQMFTFGGPVLSGIYEGYCVAGFSEELCKLVLLWLVIWHNSNFDEYFDGIVYAVFLSLGFACVENIMYVFQQGDYLSALSTGTMRAVLSIPGHFLFAVTMGYFFSLAKFDPQHRSSHLFKALLYPLLLHGTFDAILMVSSNLGAMESGLGSLVALGLFILFIIFDIKMWKWGIRRIKQLQDLTKEQDFDKNDPFKGFKWEV